MKLRVDPPIQAYPLVSRFRTEDCLLSLILVARAQLVMEAPAIPLAEARQPGPRPAKYFADGMGTSPLYAGDFAPFKPRTDVTLLGSAYVPGGREARSLVVTFGVGGWRKSLTIVGNSSWVDGLPDAVSEPEPFGRLSLRLENAYGGIKSPYNPWGKGFGEPGDAQSAPLAACNIHPIDQRIRGRDAEIPPAGFGPLAEMTLPRSALRGTFDDLWLYKRHPLPPDDFKWEFYNAAPEDQQFFPYLRGDEPLHLENLHPDYPVFAGALPGFRPRVLLRRSGPQVPPRIDEIKTVLDSVHVDADTMLVDLGWRACTAIADEEAAEVTHCYVVTEPVQAPPKPSADLVADCERWIATPG